MTPITDRLLKLAELFEQKPHEIKVSREEFAKLRTEILEHGVKWQTYRFPHLDRIELLDKGELRVTVTIDRS